MTTRTPDIIATLECKTRDGYLVATVRTRTLGKQAPYFSVTAELWDSEGWYRRGEPDGRMRAGGCMHEEVLRAFPGLRPLIDLHLSNAETGEPMHALANGWYFYSGKAHEYELASPYNRDPEDTPHERTARHLRIDPEDLPRGLDEEGFAEYVETLRPMWAEQARKEREHIAYLAETHEED